MLAKLNEENHAYADQHMRSQPSPFPCSFPFPAHDSAKEGRAQRLKQHVNLSVNMHLSSNSQPGSVLSVSLGKPRRTSRIRRKYRTN
jgi:hypothetical protein